MNWILDKVLKIASGKKAEDQVTEHDKAVQNNFAKSLMDIDEAKIDKDEAALQAGMEDARGVDRGAEYDQVGAIMAYEQGDLDDQGVLELFSHLIKSGLVWSLQGSYGRTAKSLIEAGYIDEKGTILKSVDDADTYDPVETAEDILQEPIEDFEASKKLSPIQKIAAYEKDDTSAETVEKDHKLRISGLSDYNLAELLAEAETYEKQTATLNFNEEKEKQLKSVKSDRSAAETKAWNLYKDHVHDDWKKTWEGFRAWENKPATEDDLYGKKDSKKDWRTNDKDFKSVSDEEKTDDMEGVGKEEEKGQVGKEASKKEASEVFCCDPDCSGQAHDKYEGKYYCPKHLPEKTEKKTEKKAVSPPGWEKTVEEMKTEKDIDNPFALAWYMKNKGYTPDKKSYLKANIEFKAEFPHFETKDDEGLEEEVVDLEMPPVETKDLLEEVPLGEPTKLEKPKEKVDDKITKKIEEKIEEKTEEIVEKIEEKIEEHADEMADKVQEKVEEKIDEAFEKHQVEEHPHDEKKEEVDEKKQDEDIKDLKDEHKEDDKKDDKKDDDKEDEKPEHKDDFGPEIESQLSQRDIVAHLKKTAEVNSPWEIIKDENGKDVVARTNLSKNEKVSKEDEDNKKLSKELQ